MNTYIQHEVIPCVYGTSLPENCFQDFYTLYINGKEIGGGAASEYPHKLAELYGHKNVPVLATPVFMGFTPHPKRRRVS